VTSSSLPPEPTYPVEGGCVFCTYEIPPDSVGEKHYVTVTPAVLRVRTKKGWRDLCAEHAKLQTDIPRVPFPWEGQPIPRRPG
jgi:hypothetical protein